MNPSQDTDNSIGSSPNNINRIKIDNQLIPRNNPYRQVPGRSTRLKTQNKNERNDYNCKKTSVHVAQE